MAVTQRDFSRLQSNGTLQFDLFWVVIKLHLKPMPTCMLTIKSSIMVNGSDPKDNLQMRQRKKIIHIYYLGETNKRS